MTIALLRGAAAHAASRSIPRHPVNPMEIAQSYRREIGGMPRVLAGQNPGFCHPVNICFQDDSLACAGSI